MSAPTPDLEPHRPALTGHCYRMFASVVEADDAVQETMIRAWRGLDRLDPTASIERWLLCLATTVCLDELGDRKKRSRPIEDGPPGTVDDPLRERPRGYWLEPVPDARALPEGADPAAHAALRASLRLPFVAALQHLPAKQRAAFLLTEVLGWSNEETAGCLGATVAALESALERARETMSTRNLGEPPPAPGAHAALLARWVDAFERFDLDALAELLHEDATMSMPPYSLWFRSPARIRSWFLGRGSGCSGSQLVPTTANGLPAFGQYRPDGPYALVVLEPRGDRIRAVTSFLDVEALFPRFGLPPERPAR